MVQGQGHSQIRCFLWFGKGAYMLENIVIAFDATTDWSFKKFK